MIFLQIYYYTQYTTHHRPLPFVGLTVILNVHGGIIKKGMTYLTVFLHNRLQNSRLELDIYWKGRNVHDMTTNDDDDILSIHDFNVPTTWDTYVMLCT